MDVAVPHGEGLLSGRRGLIVGVANDRSIAAGCARSFAAAGAGLALTYLNDKAFPHVKDVADIVDAEHLLKLDVEEDAEMDAVFKTLSDTWGRIDFLLHSIAYCPPDALHGRVVDCSRGGFLRTMDISVHSFVRMARLAEPLMTDGGSLLTISYYGSEKVVPNYGVMGPVKAALESATRYLAADLGPSGIRVNALSPGPIPTRAASGIDGFDGLMAGAEARSPERRLVDVDEVGDLAAFLVSDRARAITGNVEYIDAGFHATA